MIRAQARWDDADDNENDDGSDGDDDDDVWYPDDNIRFRMAWHIILQNWILYLNITNIKTWNTIIKIIYLIILLL